MPIYQSTETKEELRTRMIANAKLTKSVIIFDFEGNVRWAICPCCNNHFFPTEPCCCYQIGMYDPDHKAKTGDPAKVKYRKSPKEQRLITNLNITRNEAFWGSGYRKRKKK